LRPDIVLFTGDLFNHDSVIENKDVNFLIEQLSSIQSKYGNYAVLGDNDYSHLDAIKNIYIQSNFVLLENSYAVIHNENNDKLWIGGISSPTEAEVDFDFITNYFSNQGDVRFQIMLSHEPDQIDPILAVHPNTSLILSGHSLNGSINVPLIKKLLLPDGAKKYYEAYYEVGDAKAYISNGIGVDQINFRLINTPSINFYRIQKQ